MRSCDVSSLISDPPRHVLHLDPQLRCDESCLQLAFLRPCEAVATAPLSSCTLDSPVVEMPVALLELPASILVCVCAYVDLRDVIQAFLRTALAAQSRLPARCLSDHPLLLHRRNTPLLADRGLSSVVMQWLQPLPTIALVLSRSRSARPRGDRSVDGLFVLTLAVIQRWTAIGCLEVRAPESADCNFTVSLPALSSVLMCLPLRAIRSLHLEGCSLLSRGMDSVEHFNLLAVRLPSLRKFHFHVAQLRILGLAEFLVAHPSVRYVAVPSASTDVAALGRLFSDRTHLPHLHTLMLLFDHDFDRTFVASTLVDALAKTNMADTGQPRPIRRLELQLPCSRGAFVAASALCALEVLHIATNHPACTDDFQRLAANAFSSLRQFSQRDLAACTSGDLQLELHKLDHQPAFLVFLRTIVHANLTMLSMEVPPGAHLDSAAVARLLPLSQLQELSLACTEMIGGDQALDCSSIPPACYFGGLVRLTIRAFHLTRYTLLWLVRAAPALEHFDAQCSHDLHSFCATLIIGQHCPCIRTIKFVEYDGLGWMGVPAAGGVRPRLPGRSHRAAYPGSAQPRRILPSPQQSGAGPVSLHAVCGTGRVPRLFRLLSSAAVCAVAVGL